MHEHEHGQDESTIQRRSFLKTTGAVVGASFLAGHAVGEPDRQARFVEVGLAYDVDGGADGWTVPELEVDRPTGYAVVDGERVVLDRRLVDDAAVAPFERGGTVVSFDGFDAAPATAGGGPTGTLPVALSDTLDSRKALKLEGTTREPRLSVAADGGDATLTVAGESVSVAPGDEAQLRLAAQEVTVEAVRPPAFEAVVESGQADEAGPAVGARLDTKPVTLAAEPTVTVRNYGQVDVFDAIRE